MLFTSTFLIVYKNLHSCRADTCKFFLLLFSANVTHYYLVQMFTYTYQLFISGSLCISNMINNMYNEYVYDKMILALLSLAIA